MLDGPLQPPLNLAEFGAPDYHYTTAHDMALNINTIGLTVTHSKYKYLVKLVTVSTYSYLLDKWECWDSLNHENHK